MIPKISVIIPVYNAENYLGDCLDSVLGQSISNFEMICIDDCSTDNSYEILKKYAQTDSRIKVLQNKANLKAAGTRNVGLDNATGEYVYFIDADDYIDNGYLEEILSRAAESDADITMNLSIHTHKNGIETEYVHPSMPPMPENGSFMNNADAIELSFCVIWMRLFKREFLENHHVRFQSVNMTEDNVFHYITNVYATSIFAFNGASSYHYILRDDSVTGIVMSNNQRDYLTMKANDLIYDYLRDHDLLKKNTAKLFNVSPFFKVDTQEKYDLYKSYFIKIEGFLNDHKDMYNAAELFFANSILSSESLEDYLSRYPVSVAIAFLKNRSKSRR